MADIGDQLHNVWASISTNKKGRGANIMFISAHASDGCDEIACAFAKLAAKRTAKPVLLMDLDFVNNNQYHKLGGDKFKWQGPFDLSMSVKPFWRLIPHRRENADIEKKLLVGYRVGNSKLFVSRLRQEKVEAEQSIQIGPNTNYWNVLKGAFEINVVDAPPLEYSGAGLAIAADMDSVIMVIDADIEPNSAIEMRDNIHRHGGNIIGVIVVENNNSQIRKAAGAA
jgi:Mrp family chromosome partitioning ATPase